MHSAVNVSSRCCLFVVHPRGRLGLRLCVLLAKSERKETGVVNDITKMYNHEVGGLGEVSGQWRWFAAAERWSTEQVNREINK